MSSIGQEQSIITLEACNLSLLLQLEDDGTLAATAETFSSLARPNVYFYVETATDSGILQCKLKPYSQPEKYFAVVDGQFALKTENECTQSERLFYINQENPDYVIFYAYTAGMTHYLYCEDTDGVLAASTTNPERAAWFHIQPKDEETDIIESKEVLFTTNSLIEMINEVRAEE